MIPKNLQRVLTLLIGLTLGLGVACGAAEPAATRAPPPIVGASPIPTPTPQVAAQPREVKVNPGKLTIMLGNWGDGRFDQVLVTSTGESASYALIVHGLLISDNEKKERVPGIATQWGVSADGLTWTFTIRKGVKFHDGSELTAEDVLWSLQHYVGPEAFKYNLGAGIAVSRAMDQIALTGPDKVSVTTKRTFPTLDFLVSQAGGNWFAIMPKRATLHDTKEELAYDNNPIGAGAMRLTKHVSASVMSFERFDDFYYQPKNGLPEDRRVNFQSLDMFLVPEEATRVAALRAGAVDLVPVGLATKRQVEAGGGRLVFGQQDVIMEPRLVGCWEPRFPCHDKRVRHALDYALDKEVFQNRLYGGPQAFQIKGWHPIVPLSIGYTPAIDPWPFDPAKARQLLADAGYPGGKGFGKLIVNTYPSGAMPFQVESAQLAADFWKRELGLDVEVNVGDTVGLDKRQKSGELNGQILWRENDSRLEPTSVLTSRYGDPKSLSRVHEDPEIFLLLKETFEILDSDKRVKALEKAFLRLRDESYHLGVGYVNNSWGVGPRVLTWRPYPLAAYPSALHTITLK